MKAVVIKFTDGTYYAGCNKRPAKTLLGAQLYKSRAVAENIVKTSVNFPPHKNLIVVDIIIREEE